jgi:hypothetical protein
MLILMQNYRRTKKSSVTTVGLPLQPRASRIRSSGDIRISVLLLNTSTGSSHLRNKTFYPASVSLQSRDLRKQQLRRTPLLHKLCLFSEALHNSESNQTVARGYLGSRIESRRQGQTPTGDKHYLFKLLQLVVTRQR